MTLLQKKQNKIRVQKIYITDKLCGEDLALGETIGLIESACKQQANNALMFFY